MCARKDCVLFRITQSHFDSFLTALFAFVLPVKWTLNVSLGGGGDECACMRLYTPTYQIVHVSSGEHVCPHVGVLVEEGVEK